MLLVPFTASKVEVVVMPLFNVVVFDSQDFDVLEMDVVGRLVVLILVVVFDSQVVEGRTVDGAADVRTLEGAITMSCGMEAGTYLMWNMSCWASN